ncbi:MAG: hypothetical protein ACK5Q5_23655 [Planctomycetaceae bacterium]
MLSCLWKIAGCVVLATGLTGCCVLCPSRCSAVGYGGSYGACVAPGGCPECATGIYGAQVDPVQRARAMRLQRLRRNQSYAYGGRSPRMRQQRQGMAGGYGGGMYADPYGFNDALAFNDFGYGLDDGMMFDDGFGMETMDSGWMPASTPCNCQNVGLPSSFADEGWTEGEWVEEATGPTPTPTPMMSPGNEPTSGEPQAMPSEQLVPDPVPVTQDQYYFPLPAPGGASAVGADRPVTPGPTIQPVLWVPQGL